MKPEPADAVSGFFAPIETDLAVHLADVKRSHVDLLFLQLRLY